MVAAASPVVAAELGDDDVVVAPVQLGSNVAHPNASWTGGERQFGPAMKPARYSMAEWTV